eukprot:COSAG01_NODE_19069_length_1032_cov_9.642015_1_plen_31_part_01
MQPAVARAVVAGGEEGRRGRAPARGCRRREP